MSKVVKTRLRDIRQDPCFQQGVKDGYEAAQEGSLWLYNGDPYHDMGVDYGREAYKQRNWSSPDPSPDFLQGTKGGDSGGEPNEGKPWLNDKGQLTNGKYTIDDAGMAAHKTGSLETGKSQFLSGVDAEKAVLDAAAYADKGELWTDNTAKVYVENGPVGVIGKSGELTNWINVYRTNTGFVHGCPGGAP